MSHTQLEHVGSCDVAVIGGGFYGAYLAQKMSGDVVLLEREPDLMTQASYANQARVHNGYHYPRSVLTALRSRVNFARFVKEFREAIEDSYKSIYAVPRRFSKVTASQFFDTMTRIGAPISRADTAVSKLFDPAYIESVFLTEEYAFNADVIRELLRERLVQSDVDVRLSTSVTAVDAGKDGGPVRIKYSGRDGAGTLQAKDVICCTYSDLNRPGDAAGLDRVPLKHELAELALVEAPDALQGLGITVMDGPFFSLMPFPARQLHSLSHVRYTPHGCWYEHESDSAPAETGTHYGDRKTSFPHMLRDASRYVPSIVDCQYVESLWQVKTLLPRSERDDSRPILFRPNHCMRGYHLVMGGKIDNVYDVVDVARPVIKNLGV